MTDLLLIAAFYLRNCYGKYGTYTEPLRSHYRAFTDRLHCLCHIYKRNPPTFPPVQAGIPSSQHVANSTSHKQVCKFNQRNRPYILPWCHTNPPTYHTSELMGGSMAVHCGSLRIKCTQYGLTAFNLNRLRKIRIDCVSLAVPRCFDYGCSAMAAGYGIFENFKPTAAIPRLNVDSYE